MIYLDGTSLFKLVVRESESEALTAWLNDRIDTPLMTNAVGRIELLRAAVAHSPAAYARAQTLLTQFDVIALTPAIAALAENIDAPLPAAGAIHLASAYHLGRTNITLCTYDPALAEASHEFAISAVAPGTALTH